MKRKSKISIGIAIAGITVLSLTFWCFPRHEPGNSNFLVAGGIFSTFLIALSIIPYCRSRPIIIGIPVVILMITMGSIPLVPGVSEMGRRVACRHNLEQLGLVLRLYAQDNDGFFPESIEQFTQSHYYINGAGGLRCYSDTDPHSISYAYIPGLTLESDPKSIILKDNAENHASRHKGLRRLIYKKRYGEGINVLYIDGSVKWQPQER